MTIRNDNGPLFIAGVVWQCLKDKEVIQEFAHMVIPEENAYIEAPYSNIQQKAI